MTAQDCGHDERRTVSPPLTVGTDRSGDRMRRLNREWSEKPGPPPTDAQTTDLLAALAERNIYSRGDFERASEQAAPPLDVERRLYEALWDERPVLDAGVRGFDRRAYRAAAKRIVARLGSAPSRSTREAHRGD